MGPSGKKYQHKRCSLELAILLEKGTCFSSEQRRHFRNFWGLSPKGRILRYGTYKSIVSAQDTVGYFEPLLFLDYVWLYFETDDEDDTTTVN